MSNDAFDAMRTMPGGAQEKNADEFDSLNTMKPNTDSTSSIISDQATSGPPISLSGGTSVPQETPGLKIGTILDGRYLLAKRLGQGGMGAVWKATDVDTEEEVAIKVVHPDLAGMENATRELRREVAKAGRLAHQNLVNYRFFMDSGPVKYVLMELVDGESLEEYRLRKGGKIDIPDFLNLAEQILAGLDYIHDNGMVHLDIKPKNVMVTAAGKIKIVDYGIARSIKEQIASQNRGETETAGTLCFMAPEQIRGELCDRRADIYALGMTFYLLLHGRFPFDHTDRHEITKWHLDPKHKLRSCGNNGINQALLRLLASNVEKRFQNCDSVKTALKSASAGTPPPPPSAGGPPPFSVSDTGSSSGGPLDFSQVTPVISTPPPFVPPAAPQTSLPVTFRPLTPEDYPRLQQLSQRYPSGNGYHPWGMIPPSKLNNAKNKQRVPWGDEVFALFDFTVFGSAADGITLTNSGLCCVNLGDQPQHIPWEQLCDEDTRFDFTDGIITKNVTVFTRQRVYPINCAGSSLNLEYFVLSVIRDFIEEVKNIMQGM